MTYVVEGPTDASVARAVLRHCGWPAGRALITNGKQRLDDRLGGYNQAARYQPWLVLRDLDHDAACAGELAHSLLPDREAQMLFRLAVRSSESWLMGDAEALARCLRVRPGQIPAQPEQLPDAKASMLGVIRRSASSAVRERMLPARGSQHWVGREYSSALAGFAEARWRPAVAAVVCPSLARCLRALDDLRTTMEES